MVSVEGDNLGLNTILGYIQSFNANYYCRICKMDKKEAKYATHEDEAKMRTQSNYVDDVNLANFRLTGIKEESIFNDIRYFNLFCNSITDLMHDFPDGVIDEVTGCFFHRLILVDNVIDFDVFNSIILNFY